MNLGAGMVRVCVYLSLVLLLLGFSVWGPVNGRRTRYKPKPKPKPDKNPVEEIASVQNFDIDQVPFTKSAIFLPVALFQIV